MLVQDEKGQSGLVPMNSKDNDVTDQQKIKGSRNEVIALSIDNKNEQSNGEVYQVDKLVQEREWNEQVDLIVQEYLESLSLQNVIYSVLLWLFTFYQSINAFQSELGYICVAFFYVFYICECVNCSMYQAFRNKVQDSKGLIQFVRKLTSNCPKITFQLNKLIYSNNKDESQNNRDIPLNNLADVENKINPEGNKINLEGNKINPEGNKINPEGKTNQASQSNKSSQINDLRVKFIFQKSQLDLEVKDQNFQFVNLSSIIRERKAFKLLVNVSNNLVDESSINNWNTKKNQFIKLHEQDKSARILSSIQFFNQNQMTNNVCYFFDSGNYAQFAYATLYTIFSLVGLSIIFRVFANYFIPTIKITIQKKIRC